MPTLKNSGFIRRSGNTLHYTLNNHHRKDVEDACDRAPFTRWSERRSSNLTACLWSSRQAQEFLFLLFLSFLFVNVWTKKITKSSHQSNVNVYNQLKATLVAAELKNKDLWLLCSCVQGNYQPICHKSAGESKLLLWNFFFSFMAASEASSSKWQGSFVQQHLNKFWQQCRKCSTSRLFIPSV